MFNRRGGGIYIYTHIVHVDRHVGRLRERERERVEHLWLFELLLLCIFSRFPLTNHLALPDSESVFGMSQVPPMCVCAPLRDMDSSKEASG